MPLYVIWVQKTKYVSYNFLAMIRDGKDAANLLRLQKIDEIFHSHVKARLH